MAPTHLHHPPSAFQSPLLPPQFVRAELWLTLQAGADVMGISYRVHDPDSDAWIAAEVVPVVSIWDGIIESQRLLHDATQCALRHYGPF